VTINRSLKPPSDSAAINFRDNNFAPVLFRSVYLNDFMIVNRYEYMAKFNILERLGNSANEFVIYYFASGMFRLLRHHVSLPATK
jgi:hypothetical protein